MLVLSILCGINHQRNSGGVVANALDYQSRDCRFDYPPPSGLSDEAYDLSFGDTLKPSSLTYLINLFNQPSSKV